MTRRRGGRREGEGCRESEQMIAESEGFMERRRRVCREGEWSQGEMISRREGGSDSDRKGGREGGREGGVEGW